jgi:hypothetical protein
MRVTGAMPQVDPWRDIKTIADCKRVAEQTGNQTKEPDRPPQECWFSRASSILRDAKRLGVDAGALYRHIQRERSVVSV